MSLPKVSVIIPTYNYAAFITDAIESVLRQSYDQRCIEIIVVDDGSTDDTSSVIKPFLENGSILYFFQENKGKAHATSMGISTASGKYIFNLDADDYFLPGKLSETVMVFESDDSIVHVASPAKIIFESNPERKPEIEGLPQDMIDVKMDGNWVLKRFYNRNIMFGGGTTYAGRSDILKKLSIPDAVDMYIDEFLILAILPYGKSFFLKDPYSVWRVHNKNYSVGAESADSVNLKNDRLLKSSAAVLKYLTDNQFNEDFIRVYRLRHVTRAIVFKEKRDYKTFADVLSYASEVFMQIKPGWKLIRTYNVMNRLLPISFLNFVRSLISKRRLA